MNSRSTALTGQQCTLPASSQAQTHLPKNRIRMFWICASPGTGKFSVQVEERRPDTQPTYRYRYATLTSLRLLKRILGDREPIHATLTDLGPALAYKVERGSAMSNSITPTQIKDPPIHFIAKEKGTTFLHRETLAAIFTSLALATSGEERHGILLAATACGLKVQQ